MDPRWAPIAESIASWGGSAPIDRELYGSEDAAEIGAALEGFCREHLGAGVAGAMFHDSSQGAVTGLDLDDGRRVVVKVHRAKRDRRYLAAMVEVQKSLAAVGYPAPAVLAGPLPFGPGRAVVEDYVDPGPGDHRPGPAERRVLAEGLARLVRLAAPFVAEGALEGDGFRLDPPPGELWPEPHSPIFDFAATAEGAEHVDALAAEAWAIVARGDGRLVIGHTDWRPEHVRIADGRIRAVYDWDSLLRVPEPRLVGSVSAHFTVYDHRALDRVPTPEESAAFVAAYEAARGEPFTAVEHEAIAAARTYARCYTARCEHGIPGRPAPPGGFWDALHPEIRTYLSR